MPPVESSASGTPVTEFCCTLKGGANATENLICIKGWSKHASQKDIDENSKAKPTCFILVCKLNHIIKNCCMHSTTPRLWQFRRAHCHHAPLIKKNKIMIITMVCHYHVHIKNKKTSGACKYHQRKSLSIVFMQQGK
jgi:hypothetical protein